MTLQVQDSVNINGASYKANPTFDVSEKSHPGVIARDYKDINSGCWRGYVASWSIEGNWVFLNDINGIYGKSYKDKIFADWLTGTYICSLSTEDREYFNPEFTKKIDIKNGIVINSENIHDENKYKGMPGNPTLNLIIELSKLTTYLAACLAPLYFLIKGLDLSTSALYFYITLTVICVAYLLLFSETSEDLKTATADIRKNNHLIFIKNAKSNPKFYCEQLIKFYYDKNEPQVAIWWTEYFSNFLPQLAEDLANKYYDDSQNNNFKYLALKYFKRAKDQHEIDKNYQKIFMLEFKIQELQKLVDSNDSEVMKSQEITEKAESGDSIAQFELYKRYLTGAGLNKNIEFALFWLEKAVSQNEFNALCEVSKLYEKGMHGYPIKYAEAASFLAFASSIKPNQVSEFDIVRLNNLALEQLNNSLDNYYSLCESEPEKILLTSLIERWNLYPGGMNNLLVGNDGIEVKLQQSIGKYRADFLINDKLILEVDGRKYHENDNSFVKDRLRDQELFFSHKIFTMRYPATQIINNADAVVDKIYNWVQSN